MTTPMPIDASNSGYPNRLAPIKDADPSNSIVPNKEAVAALSAALAFRRFDPPAMVTTTVAQTNHDADDGNSHAADGNYESPSGSCDSLRRLSGILNGRAGGGMRRSSLDTILSSSASINHASHSFRGSLRNSCNGMGLELLNMPMQPHSTLKTRDVSVMDNNSLNSDDLHNDDDIDELGGSMTISLLEDKQLDSQFDHFVPDNTDNESSASCDCGSSDDDTSCNTSCNNESVDLLEEGDKGDDFPNNKYTHHDGKGSSSTQRFVSSLQKILSKASSSKSQNKNDRRRTFGSSSGSSGYNPSSRSKKNFNKSLETSLREKSSLSSCLTNSHLQDDLTTPINYASGEGFVRKRSRVSWSIEGGGGDDDDVFLNAASRRPYARLSIDHGSNIGNKSNAEGRPRFVPLVSEDGAGSIDPETLAPTSTSTGTATDEELLASLILASSMGSLWSRMSSHQRDDEHAVGINTSSRSGESPKEKASSRMSLSPDVVAPEEIVLQTSLAERGKRDEATTENLEEDISRRLASSKTPTVATVTRLAYQEVEDYRLRLQRKRALMVDEGEMGAADTSAPPSSEEIQDLNGLLLENATNISNALLLQRALYILGGVPSSAGANAEFNTLNNNESIRKSRSEHTGIDQMALNHFLAISSSATSGTSNNNNANVNANAANSQSSANWSIISPYAATSNDNASSNPRGSSFTNPFSAISARRNTYQEGMGQSSSRRGTAIETPQIGAYQSNEPAPLLFRRTFASSGPNRREARAEARRNTLQVLARERRLGSCGGRFDGENLSSSGSSTDDDCWLRPNDSSNDNVHDISHSNIDNHERQHRSNTGEIAAQTASPAASSTTTSLSSLNTNRRHDGLSDANNGDNDSVDHPSIETNLCNPTLTHNQSLGDLLRASVQHGGVGSELLQAILVSDEIIEADHVHTVDHSRDDHRPRNYQSSSLCMHCSTQFGDEEDVENLVPFLRERITKMEDLMKEQEEENRHVFGRYRRRERTLVALVFVLMALIIVLIIAFTSGFR
mmetsp:Transcript_11394/g.24706  ORF Transcript_11394/g.24706 Transcript_11394/m.24706 type:complete len:1021 (-) Transcript_11394:167-3229(-)